MAPLHLLTLTSMAALLLPLTTAAALQYPPGGAASGVQQDLEALKEQIMTHVAAELDAAWRNRDVPQKMDLTKDMARKRMFVPLSGLPGEVPTIKRQIRYHQCYFNPISCFRK